MEGISLSLIVLRYIPETAILVALSVVLTGYELKLKEIILIAVIGSPFIGVARLFIPIPGINTIIVFPLLILLIFYFYKINLASSAIVSALGLIIMGMTETAYLFMLSGLTGANIIQALANPLWKLLIPVPEYLFLSALIIICKRFRLTILNIREFNDIRRINSHER
jgi:hypothetical protein